MNPNFKSDLKDIKAFVFDVDGVFSGNVVLLPSGELMRSMNVKDGFAVQYAIKMGYPVGIITGSNSEEVRTRFERLGVKNVYLTSRDKLFDFHDFLRIYKLTPGQVLYMGDDLPDLPVLKIAGVAACPSDAAIEIKDISRYVSPFSGGSGCVRDILEQVLRIQGNWGHPEAYKW